METKKTTKKAEVTKEAATIKAFSVIETGGKQYRVSVGDAVNIEKISDTMKEGEAVSFDKILLTDNGTETVLGAPYISGAKVNATIEEIGRAKKILVVKYKQKSKYLKRNGHRQPFFKVRINSI